MLIKTDARRLPAQWSGTAPVLPRLHWGLKLQATRHNRTDSEVEADLQRNQKTYEPKMATASFSYDRFSHRMYETGGEKSDTTTAQAVHDACRKLEGTDLLVLTYSYFACSMHCFPKSGLRSLMGGPL